MKGYKALDMEIETENKVQHKADEGYFVERNSVLLRREARFCKDIEHLSYYDGIRNKRIFEIEACGRIIKFGERYVAEKIKFIRELTKEEINDYFRQNQKKFIESGIWYIRKAAVEHGFGLDVLIHDRSSIVRRAVAEQGYGLDMLIYDDDREVRIAVAEQGYGLDTLIHDEDDCVRYTAYQMLEKSFL